MLLFNLYKTLFRNYVTETCIDPPTTRFDMELSVGGAWWSDNQTVSLSYDQCLKLRLPARIISIPNVWYT